MGQVLEASVIAIFSILCLPRFVFHDLVSTKIDSKVVFPVENLDLSDCVSGPEVDDLVYDLQACVCHFGGVYGPLIICADQCLKAYSHMSWVSTSIATCVMTQELDLKMGLHHRSLDPHRCISTKTSLQPSVDNVVEQKNCVTDGFSGAFWHFSHELEPGVFICLVFARQEETIFLSYYVDFNIIDYKCIFQVQALVTTQPTPNTQCYRSGITTMMKHKHYRNLWNLTTVMPMCSFIRNKVRLLML